MAGKVTKAAVHISKSKTPRIQRPRKGLKICSCINLFILVHLFTPIEVERFMSYLFKKLFVRSHNHQFFFGHLSDYFQNDFCRFGIQICRKPWRPSLHSGASAGSGKAELDELNRGLPYMLDEHTSLTATTCKDNTLTYDYLIKDGDTMKFSKMPEASLKFLKDAMPTSMLNDKLCREIKTFTTHLKNVRYNFRLENGELLSTAIEPLSRCQM